MLSAGLKLAILDSLYDLSRRNLPTTPSVLAQRIGTSSELAEQTLRWLESRGLVDAKRVRLTLKGLALIHAYKEQSAAGEDNNPLAA